MMEIEITPNYYLLWFFGLIYFVMFIVFSEKYLKVYREINKLMKLRRALKLKTGYVENLLLKALRVKKSTYRLYGVAFVIQFFLAIMLKPFDGFNIVAHFILTSIFLLLQAGVFWIKGHSVERNTKFQGFFRL